MRSGSKLSPINALSHPMWISALIVLFVNDQFLKQSELAGAVTGKLSDFAGLMVAPILLAAIVGVRSRRGVLACAMLTGAVFGAINVSPVVAATFDRLVSSVVPYTTVVDPTDLIALVAIPFALAIYRERLHRAPQKRTAARVGVMVAASTICVATSMAEVPCETDADCEQYEFCFEGNYCELKPTPCSTNADCNSGYQCVSDVCEYVPTSNGSNDAMRSLDMTPIDRALDASQPPVDQFQLFEFDEAFTPLTELQP